MTAQNLPSITRRATGHTCLADQTIDIVETVTTEYTLFIDGRRTEAASGRRYDSVDPYLGQPWASAADGDAADVDAAVAAARRALTGPWGQLTGVGRAALMRRLGDLIARDADRLAEIETRDTGKLLREMRGQLGSIPDWFYYFSGLADKLEGTTIPGDKPNFLVYTRREPAGVVAAIVPWNSPLLLLCWKLAPALAAGCTMVAKPSDYSPASAVELAALMDEAGFPPGVFNVVTGFGPAVGKALAAHPGVDKVAFTGSTSVGAQGGAGAAGDHTGVRRRPRRTSPGCCWSWAASPRTWSSTTPTWTRPATACWPGCSPPPGRPAWPAPGSWWPEPCTTSWWPRSRTGPPRSGSATRR